MRHNLFWSNFLRICVGAWRHWMTDRLGTTVTMETAAPHVGYVTSYQQSEKPTAILRDIKLGGHIRSDGVNVLWLKATCGLKLNSCLDIKWTSSLLNRYTVCDVRLWLQVGVICSTKICQYIYRYFSILERCAFYSKFLYYIQCVLYTYSNSKYYSPFPLRCLKGHCNYAVICLYYYLSIRSIDLRVIYTDIMEIVISTHAN